MGMTISQLQVLEMINGGTQAKAERVAAAHGMKCRVVRVNGQARLVTMDYDPNRLNLDIVHGLVKGAHYG